MSLDEKIQLDLIGAMKSKDRLRLAVLRMMKTALKNKEIETRSSLKDETARGVLQTLVKQRRDSAEQFRRGGREELASKEELEIKVITEYLPRAATDAEIQSAVRTAIGETKATSMKEMGTVMRAAMVHLSGTTVDGAKVSELAREALTNS